LAQQELPAADLSHVESHDIDSVEPLRPSKDGNSSSASSSGSGRMSPLPRDFDTKQNSAVVEQMISASSKSSRQAMDNLRSGSLPFARVQKDVKENMMVGKSSAGEAVATVAADPSKAQHPKSRLILLRPQ
jgi:hypothetical protein